MPRRRPCQRLVKFAFRTLIYAHEMFFRPPCALRAVAKRRPLIMNHRMAFVAKRKHVLQLLYLFLRVEAPFFVRFEAAVSPAADTALIHGPFIRVPPHRVPRARDGVRVGRRGGVVLRRLPCGEAAVPARLVLGAARRGVRALTT